MASPYGSGPPTYKPCGCRETDTLLSRSRSYAASELHEQNHGCGGGALVASILFIFGVFSYVAYNSSLFPTGPAHPHLSWIGLEGSDRCTAYNAREYTARLSNLPLGLNGMDACMTTPIVIHGATLDKPEWCEDHGDSVVGHWVVNSGEPMCSTFWKSFTDKGCVAGGSGRRRFEATLENLRDQDDGAEMCATTPAHFDWKDFDGPTYCVDRGKHRLFGIWEIEDSNC